MISELLNKYNTSLFTAYAASRFEKSIDCVMPGYFAGNRILFVGQNPGLLKESVEGDMKYLEAYKNREYSKIEEYYKDALFSDKGTLGVFIHDVYGKDWTDISFTNVFKCPFDKNVVPKEIPQYELDVLYSQIKLLKPKIIVAIGTTARVALSRLSMRFLQFRHPSFLKRSGLYNKEIAFYRKELKHELSLIKNDKQTTIFDFVGQNNIKY